MLLAPLRTRATHVVTFGSIIAGPVVRQAAPGLGDDRAKTPSRPQQGCQYERCVCHHGSHPVTSTKLVSRSSSPRRKHSRWNLDHCDKWIIKRHPLLLLQCLFCLYLTDTYYLSKFYAASLTFRAKGTSHDRSTVKFRPTTLWTVTFETCHSKTMQTCFTLDFLMKY